MTKACDSQKDIQYPILFSRSPFMLLSIRFCWHDDEEAKDTNKEFGLVAYYIVCNIALTESSLSSFLPPQRNQCLHVDLMQTGKSN